MRREACVDDAPTDDLDSRNAMTGMGEGSLISGDDLSAVSRISPAQSRFLGTYDSSGNRLSLSYLPCAASMASAEVARLTRASTSSSWE